MVTINSNVNPPSPVLDGTDVTLTCNVTMGQGVLSSDLSLLMVNTQLSRDGTKLNRMMSISGTTFTYTIQLNSFGRNDSGNYTCTANVTLLQPSTYLTGIRQGTDSIEIVIGKRLNPVHKCFNCDHIVLCMLFINISVVSGLTVHAWQNKEKLKVGFQDYPVCMNDLSQLQGKHSDLWRGRRTGSHVKSDNDKIVSGLLVMNSHAIIKLVIFLR